MILNVTLKMILRSWWRNKVFFLVSVASLALGLACTNLLMTYFVHEHGLEGRNPDRDRIVFLQQDDPMNEGKRVAYAAAEIPQRLKNSYAEVEDYLRMGTLHLLGCKVDGQKVESNFIVLSTDTTLTRFFDYRAAEGSLEQALRQPNKVALSAACARKLFGSREVVGQHIEVQMEGGDRQTYEVAAVLKEREQSLLHFDMLTASAANYWGGPTLLKLSKGTNAARLADKINADKVPTMLPDQTKYYLDPLEAVCFTTPDDASQQVLDYISQLTVQRPGGEEIRTHLLKLAGDSTLVRTLGLELLEGGSVEQIQQRYAYPVLVNESFVRTLVPEGSPVGRSLREFDTAAEDTLSVIAGVIRDFPINSLEEEIAPAVVSIAPMSRLEKAFCLQIRLRPENRAETLQQIEAVWDELHPGQPFQYTDMHQDFMKRNGKVLSLSRILTFYALIGLLLTGFGLFGIAWYATRQRIREISIRKVHGATRGQIIWLLNKPFCLYAAVAYVLAMPIAWWLMQRWLEQFAYRAPLSVGIFVWPLVVVWGVSALIVCLQGWMLSRVKPVEAMKNE